MTAPRCSEGLARGMRGKSKCSFAYPPWKRMKVAIISCLRPNWLMALPITASLKAEVASLQNQLTPLMRLAMLPGDPRLTMIGC